MVAVAMPRSAVEYASDIVPPETPQIREMSWHFVRSVAHAACGETDAARALCIWVNVPANPTGELADLGATAFAVWQRSDTAVDEHAGDRDDGEHHQPDQDQPGGAAVCRGPVSWHAGWR